MSRILPTYFEYTVMSDYAYLDKTDEEKNKLLSKLNRWKVFDCSEGDCNSGYVGSVFIHDLRRQIVIAHAGTLPSRLKTFLADARGVVGGQPDPLLMDSLMQSQGQDQRSLQDLVTQEGYHVSFTGHSLGGFLAELSVYACHRGFGLFYPDASAVTFDSPGSLEVMEDWESHIPKEQIDLKQLNIISFLSSPNLVNTLHSHPGTVYRLVRPMPALSFLSYLKESHARKKMFALFNAETGFPEAGCCVEMADWPLADYEELLLLKDHPVSGGADVLVTKTLDVVGHLGKGILGRLSGSQKKVKLSKLFGGSEATKLSALLRDAAEKNYHIQFDTDTASGLSGAVNTHYIVKQLTESIPSALYLRMPLINIFPSTVDFLRFHQVQQDNPLYKNYIRDRKVTISLPAYDVNKAAGYLYLVDKHPEFRTIFHLLDAVERLTFPPDMSSSSSSSSSSAPRIPSLVNKKTWKGDYQAYLEATVKDSAKKAKQAGPKLKQLKKETSTNKNEVKALEQKQADLEQTVASLQQTLSYMPVRPSEEAELLGNRIREQPETVYEAWCDTMPRENPNFSGREDLLKELIKSFIIRDDHAKRLLRTNVCYQAVMGLGGVGKTQVAARYVHLCLAYQRAAAARGGFMPAIFEDVVRDIRLDEPPSMPGPYHAIIWLDASDERSLLRSFRSVADKIGLVFESQAADDLVNVREAVYARLGHLPRVLFVWDDVTEATAIHEHLPNVSSSTWRGACDCLLTTRDRLLAEDYHGLEVGLFSRDESVAYLKQALTIEAKPDNELENLAMTLGHLPLALAQAVGYLNRQRGRVDIGEYLRRYASNQTELLDKLPTGNDRYVETVLTTWLLSIAELSQTPQGSQAVQLLLASSFLAGQCIEYDVLQAYMKQSEIGLEELIECLSHYSLVDSLSEQRDIRVHALVQDVMQLWLKGNLQTHVQQSARHDKTKASKAPSSLDVLANNLRSQEVRATWMEVAMALQTCLLQVAKSTEPSMAELGRRKRLLPHLGAFMARLNHPLASLSHKESNSFLSLPDVLAMDLYYEQGLIAKEHGYYKEAKGAFEVCLKLQQVQYGYNSLKVVATLNSLGNVEGALGNPRVKRDFLKQALPILKTHCGEDHVEVAKMLNNLGNVLGDLGDHQASKELLEKAVNIEKKWYAEDDKNYVELAGTLHNLGNTIQALGNLERAKELLEEALAIQAKHYGKEHIEVAKTLIDLGSVLGELGDRQANKKLLEQALKIEEVYYGKDHVEVAKTLNNLGTVLGDLGDHQAAKALLERAIKIQEAYYGEHHVELVVTLFNLGMTNKALGNIQEAMGYLLRAFILMTSKPGYEHHPHLNISVYQLSMLASEYPEDYEALLTEADSLTKQNYAASQAYMGDCYLVGNQPALALRYYERAIQLSPTTTNVYHNAACCYHMNGAIEQAQACFAQGIAYRPTSAIHIEYAHFLYLRRQYAQALEHIQASRALPVVELSYGPSEKSVIAPLLQRLLSSDDKRIKLPTDGLGYYLAYECYLGLGQLNAAREAMNQFSQYCNDTDHETLTELYALILSLPQRSSEAILNQTLSSSSNAFFQPAGSEESSSPEKSFSPG